MPVANWAHAVLHHQSELPVGISLCRFQRPRVLLPSRRHGLRARVPNARGGLEDAAEVEAHDPT